MARTKKHVSKVTIVDPQEQPTDVVLTGGTVTLADLREWFLCTEALAGFDDTADVEVYQSYDESTLTASVYAVV